VEKDNGGGFMGSSFSDVGLTKYDLDTPALIADLDVVEKNAAKMANYCKAEGISLRPHTKLYKAAPFFASLQMEAGAIGMTVSKLGDAEILAAAGIKSILIANQVVGETKTRRLASLCSYADVMAAVDSIENIKMISDIASSLGTEVGLLVEAEIGNNRCGAEPEIEAVELARAITNLPGVKFRGLMGYDGHLAFMEDPAEKERKSLACYNVLSTLKRKLISLGIPVEIVSGGGSCTYKYACKNKDLTELQAGSYLFNDTAYREKAMLDFDLALTVMATVISKKGRPGFENMAVMDLGNKSMSLAYGFPEVKSVKGEIFSMPQQHCRIRTEAGTELKAGDKVEVWVRDANGTFNLYDHVYLARGEKIVGAVEIYGHGCTI